MKKSYLHTLYILLAFWGGYEAHDNKLFPLGRFFERTFLEKSTTTMMQQKINVFGNVSERSEVDCPKKDNAYVIIGFGQSNSANSAGHRFKTNKNILNFFNGKCYIANDPMLGATGTRGSIWIPLSEELKIEDRVIVLATFGIGGSKVSDWLDKTRLYPFYTENIASLKRLYENPQAVVWIQGESDVSTPNEVFNIQLKQWFKILRSDFKQSNIFVTGTSYCSNRSNENVLLSQRKNAKEIGAIYVGSTDDLFEQDYRYDDCHFSEKGIRELALLIKKSWIK